MQSSREFISTTLVYGMIASSSATQPTFMIALDDLF